MRIGELARQVGISTQTIRYYERQGLMGAFPSQRSQSNYRMYPEDSIERLRTINRAKELGFSLSEILALSRLWDSGRLKHQQQIAALQKKLDELAYKRLMLDQLEKVVYDKLVKLKTKSKSS
jgi:DNA-binding transcriptional MerR regulator